MFSSHVINTSWYNIFNFLQESKLKKMDQTFDLLLPPITRDPKKNEGNTNTDLSLKKATLLPLLQRPQHTESTKLPPILPKKQYNPSKQQEILQNNQQQIQQKVEIQPKEQNENKGEIEKGMRCYLCRKRTPLATAFLCRFSP